jgi:hypothetical protein
MSALILSTLAVFVAGITAAAEVISLRRQRQYAMTQALFELQLFLAQPQFRSARAAVRQDSWNGSDLEAAGLVCSSFDFAGLMVRRGLVDQDVFFEYWGPILCLFRERLNTFLDQTVGGELRGREYWRDFQWIIDETIRRDHDRGVTTGLAHTPAT